MRLDLKDQKILHTIEFNARLPISQVAREVKLSKEVTNYRIKKLEKEGIISGYRTLFNLFNLGQDYYVILFKIKNYHTIEQEILDYLKTIRRRSRIIICDGRWNIILTLRSESVQQMMEEIYGFVDKYGELIEDRQILLTKEMFISKCYSIYPGIEKNPDEIAPVKRNLFNVKKLSPMEKLITQKLAVQPKFLLNQLANDLNLDVKTTKKYINNLRNNNFIIHYRTYINAEKLGFKRFYVLLSFNNLSKGNKELIEHLKICRNIPVIYTCFGNADLVFEMLISDINELFTFLKGLSVKYSSKIKEYTLLPIIKYERNPS